MQETSRHQVISLNYLHFGEAWLELTSKSENIEESGSLRKTARADLVPDTAKDGRSKYALDIERYVMRRRNSQLDDYEMERRAHLESSRFFQSLRCRGFSFDFVERPEMFEFVPSHVGLRFCIEYNAELYYPPKVRRILNKYSFRHYPRVLAWLLATEVSIAGCKTWLIQNLQSDASSIGYSAIRGHFRGWQRVIVSLFCVMGIARGIDGIGIVPADRLFGHGSCSRLVSMMHIYDETGRFFGMEEITLGGELVIQTLVRGHAVGCSRIMFAKCVDMARMVHYTAEMLRATNAKVAGHLI